MNVSLVFAGTLATVGGIVHSYMGERMILIPLFRDGAVPQTPFGNAHFTRRMIRGVWHFFTIMVSSAAVLFFMLSGGDVDGANQTVVRVLAVYWAVFAVAALVLSRGRHFAWLLGSVITALAWLGTL